MASYESRSRHHDSFSHSSRTLDPFYHERSSRGRHDASRRSRSSYDDPNKRQDRDRSPRRQRSSQHLRSSSHRPDRKGTGRWPPAPFAEDEKKSAAREYKPRILGRGDEAPMRGTVDQEPTIIDLAPPLVHISQDRASYTTRKGRDSKNLWEGPRRPSVDTSMGGLPELAKRQPSPYSYSKPAKASATRPSGEFLLSPEPMTPDSISSKKPPSIRQAKPEVRRDGREQRPRNPLSGSPQPVFAGSESEESDTERLRDRKPSRYSFAPTELNRTNLRTSLRQNNESKASRPRPNGQGEQGGEPFFRSEHRDRQSSKMRDEKSSKESSRRNSKDSSRSDASSFRHSARASSPTRSERRSSTTPPRSKLGSRSGSPLSPTFPSNILGTTAAAATAATAASQHRRDASGSSRIHTYPQMNTHSDSRKIPQDPRRTESLYEPSQQAPRIGVQSPSPQPPLSQSLPYPRDSPLHRKSAPLPYPDDHMSAIMMPCEESFQSEASSPRTTQSQHSFNDAQNRTTSQMKQSQPHRATAATDEHSRAESLRSKEKLSTKDAHQLKESPDSSKGLPPCPRGTYSTKYDDWSTLPGLSSSFNVCPYCYDNVFASTEFSSLFHRSPRKLAGTQTRCSFSCPWMRMAWLLTLRRQRRNLDLLYDLASVSAQEQECPGAAEAQRNWYGLTDDYGDMVANFRICPADVRQLEVLLPSTRNVFLRIPRSKSNGASLCTLRTQNSRFSAYLDLLVEIDDAALGRTRRGTLSSPTNGRSNGNRQSRAEPDFREFITLVRSQGYKFECPRDNIVLDTAWHFMPSLPEFTVCEECYDAVVWPEINSGSALAGRFHRTMQYVSTDPTTMAALAESGSRDVGLIMEGSSCQLYSPRMRRVWRDAVMDDDTRYLERRARERKRVEVELQVQMKDLTKLVEGGGSRGSWEDEKVKAKVGRIMDTWKEYE